MCRQCEPGYTCDEKSRNDCQAGSYCSNNSAEQCSTGTFAFNYAIGRATNDSCNFCPPGAICSNEGITEDDLEPCGAGYICSQEGISDESQADECSSGTYCPGVDEIGTLNVQECPSGTYFVGTGAEDDKSCDLCLPGQYCVNSGLSEPTGECKYGYNCDKEGETVSNPQDKICPKGSFCNGNSTEPCPIGYYRDLEGGMPVDDCFKCPAGKYCNSLGLEKSAENLDLCPKGYYCDGYDVSTDSTMKKPCGDYCPDVHHLSQ